MISLTRAMSFGFGIFSFLFFLNASPALAQANEKLSATDIAARTVLGFKISDEKLKGVLPPGWELNVPSTGPSKGVNFSLVLIHPTIAQDAEGKPQSTNSYAVLVVPAKKIGTTLAGSMVFGGFMAQQDVPGAYGVYVPANVTVRRQQHSQSNGKTMVDETWEVHASDSSTIKINVEFSRDILTRSKIEAKVYSAIKPEFFRIYRLEQAAAFVKSAATAESQVKKFSITASGPKLSQLLDGSEQLISVASIPHYIRSIYLPIL